MHAAISNIESTRSVALFEPVFFRALYLTSDEQVLESAARFFANYADQVTAGEPEMISEMIDF